MSLVQALSALSAPLKALNDLLHTKAGRKSPTRLRDVAVTVASLQAVMGLLGLETQTLRTVLEVRTGFGLNIWADSPAVAAHAWNGMGQEWCS